MSLHPRFLQFSHRVAILVTLLLFVGTLESHAARKNKKKAKEDTEAETPKWDVEKPPYPTHEVPIDVDQGTWMFLDVSPEGDEILFDLLGDIYSLSIEGGEAKRLTQGISWDMQPTYSPNGLSVAFTSDRSGGDNIWTMDRNGENLKQISDESFRLVNSPAWTPDSQYIAGHKHFSSQRSLGAGEIWLYHRSGSDGLQMTERRNDQKDLGEPSFSPDGEFLYYSHDATPGDTFTYSKDSNGEIYVIYRLERETGRIERFVSGPGGAVRPTPSPDGSRLAFVRRVGFQSTLFLKDLDSGREEAVYSGLERDMQETWAIHGVYPSMAWTPDSRDLIFWAQGKIHRLNTETFESTEIPFHVSDSREIATALRHPVEVSESTTDVRMLRWLTASPTGNQAVFQALGYLWVRELPDGEARRLTAQEDHWEYYPNYSRDGQWIVYTTWSEEEMGTVRMVSAEGGEGRVLTRDKGHYLEPSFAPDRSGVVYRRTTGGWLRTPLWSQDPGIYWAEIQDEGEGPTESMLVTRDGVEPHFGSDPNRVFLLRYSGEDSRDLVSVQLDGGEEREHAAGGFVSEFRVSPDGQWVAFGERYQTYLAAMPLTGRKIDLGPSSSAMPTVRVSKNGGSHLRWSADSSTLGWALRPELFQRELKDLFAFQTGAPEELPEAPERGVDLSFSGATDAPEGMLAVVGAKLVTLRGDEVIESGTVVIEGNRILDVGAADAVEVPEEAYVVDGVGKVIIPGLVDVHWHGSFGSEQIIPEQNWVTYASLAFGVTTAHDPSNDTQEVFAAAELQRTGAIISPRIFSTGTIVYGAEAGVLAEIDSLDDAREHLKRLKSAGAFSIKSYNQPRRDQRQQVIEAARELGMLVVPEGGSTFQHNLTMIIDGHTGIEHSIPVAAIYDDVKQLWAASETGYTPTLGVGYGGLWGENYWYQHTEVWKNERLLTFVPKRRIDPVSRRRMMAPEDEYNHFNNARVAAELQDLGVLVNLGAHGQREGLAAHWELWMFEQGGMTPLEALRAGTLDGAKYLGMDHEIGSLEPGKLADLVVLGADPLEDIRNTEAVDYVIANGRLFDAKTMEQLGNEPAPAPQFYFSEDSSLGMSCTGSFCEGPSYGRCVH